MRSFASKESSQIGLDKTLSVQDLFRQKNPFSIQSKRREGDTQRHWLPANCGRAIKRWYRMCVIVTQATARGVVWQQRMRRAHAL